MKKLIKILDLFHNLPQDKQNHLMVGYILASILIPTFGWWGALAVVIAAAGKELIWDLALGKGNAEWADFLYTVAPVPLFLILKYIIWAYLQ